jgi:hypothetical protein
MSKLEDLLTDLTTQVSRLAFAVEALASNQGVPSQHTPCRGCGCRLTAVFLPFTTCPVCRTENAR